MAWRTSSGWRQLLAEVVVGPLSDADARLLIDGALPPDTAAQVLRFGGGHPLALQLAAEASLAIPGWSSRTVHRRRSSRSCSRCCSTTWSRGSADGGERGGVAPGHPTAAGRGGHRRREGADLQGAWRALRELPFTVTTAAGIEFQPVARQAVAGALEIRDPARVRRLRRQAAEAALRDIERGPSWNATADLLYLVQNPIIRNCYLPPDGEQHPVEAATADDLAAVLAITERYDGPDGLAIIEAWWRAHRAGFVVGRGPDGRDRVQRARPLAEVDLGLAELDPVLAAFLRDSGRVRCRRRHRTGAPAKPGPAARREAIARARRHGGGHETALPGAAAGTGPGVRGGHPMADGGAGHAPAGVRPHRPRGRHRWAGPPAVRAGLRAGQRRRLATAARAGRVGAAGPGPHHRRHRSPHSRRCSPGSAPGSGRCWPCWPKA